MNTLFTMLAKLARGMGRYPYKRTVSCPESGQPEEILVHAFSGSPSKRKKKPLSIRKRSLSPKRSGCTQGCLK